MNAQPGIGPRPLRRQALGAVAPLQPAPDSGFPGRDCLNLLVEPFWQPHALSPKPAMIAQVVSALITVVQKPNLT